MKIFLVTLLLSITAFADTDLVLQKVCEDRFLGDREVTKMTGKPLRPVKVKFSRPIDKILVNNIENLLERSDDDSDIVKKEIYFYAGNDVLNCYATFKNGEFKSLIKCAEIYPKEVSGYGID